MSNFANFAAAQGVAIGLQAIVTSSTLSYPIRLTFNVLIGSTIFTAAFFLRPPDPVTGPLSALKFATIKTLTLGVIGGAAISFTRSLSMEVTSNDEDSSLVAHLDKGSFYSGSEFMFYNFAFRNTLEGASHLASHLFFGNNKMFLASAMCAAGGTSNFIFYDSTMKEFALGCYNFISYNNLLGINHPNPFVTSFGIDFMENAVRKDQQLSEYFSRSSNNTYEYREDAHDSKVVEDSNFSLFSGSDDQKCPLPEIS